MGVDQRAVQRTRMRGLVTAGRRVVSKRRGIDHLGGNGPDSDVDTGLSQEIARLAIEVRDRHRAQPNRVRRAVAGLQDQSVTE